MTGMVGTVTAKIIALTTEHAQAKTSARNLSLLLLQSCLIYCQILLPAIVIHSIFPLPI